MRIGVAKALKPGMTTRPKFNSNWTIEDTGTLERLLAEIKNSLKHENFGLYFAFRRVFGEQVAIRIGSEGQFEVPPINVTD